MTPTRWTWWWYGACAFAVMGGLGWASFQALEFERREAQAQADARLQEAVRLTLWRMESSLAPIIARESSRPYFEYRSFYPADRAYTNMLEDYTPGEVLVPSPLLRTPDEPIVLHFEVDPERGVLSPQVPAENVPLAANTFATSYEIAAAEVKLRSLRDALTPSPRFATGEAAPASDQDAGRRYGGSEEGRKSAGVPASDAPTGLPKDSRGTAGFDDAQVRAVRELQSASQQAPQLKQQAEIPPAGSQVTQNLAEYAERSRASESYNRPTRMEPKQEVSLAMPGSPDRKDKAASDAKEEKPGGGPLYKKEDGELREPVTSGAPEGNLSRDVAGDSKAVVTAATPETVVTQGELVARWLGGPTEASILVLSREVSVGARRWTQGFWLDWPKLRARLLNAGGGLIPGATLVPAGDVNLADAAALGRRLAAIPAELVIPAQPPVVIEGWSPLRTTLVMTWVGALGGVIAIGLVLRTSTELAERRGRFVSAVTHELRTPLTTFCMYSQMLSDGIVKDPEAQQSYFNTLRSESQRLARIVESVLDYARLGRRKPGNGKVVMRVGELVDQCVGALAARCEQAGMMLVVQRDGGEDQPITTDPATIERVLFNLVDNACKYAAESEDKRVHLDVRVSVREVELWVRDHGPGIERAEKGRIFRPFVRGRRQVDGSVSGLGLGLALAKGLAEQLGGDLKLAGAEGGAVFSLTLPLGT